MTTKHDSDKDRSWERTDPAVRKLFHSLMRDGHTHAAIGLLGDAFEAIRHDVAHHANGEEHVTFRGELTHWWSAVYTLFREYVTECLGDGELRHLDYWVETFRNGRLYNPNGYGEVAYSRLSESQRQRGEK